jgi:hypothetical protein
MSFRKGLALATVGLLAVTVGAGGATAKPGKSQGKALGKISAKRCSAEKKVLGKDAFNELYGKPSMPNCLGVKRSEGAPVVKRASKACKAERNEMGVEAFSEKYGSNKNRRNAFGKCVSRKSGKKLGKVLGKESGKVLNAARQCKAERSDPSFADTHEGKTFDEFYGTNKNLKNAFGKCVSSKAKAPAPTA